MKAKVINLHKNPTLIHGAPVKVGDTVEVTHNEFVNLQRNGVLEAADKDSAKLADVERSTLTETEAEKQIEAANEAREAKKRADEAAKKSANN